MRDTSDEDQDQNRIEGEATQRLLAHPCVKGIIPGVGGCVCVAVIAGCGGTSISQRPCAGLPTAPYGGHFLVLFGALNRLTKKDVCAHIGAPRSVKALPDGRELWSYGPNTVTVTFKHGRVVATRGKAPIGG